MAEVIGANDRAALAAVEDLPVLNVADLDADPHGMFRRYRAAYPFVGHETGGYLVLRHADIERLGNDPRTAASETVHPGLFVVTEGALFDFFEQAGSMSGMWKRSHGGTTKAPPDERGGNGYVLPNATAPHLDSTLTAKR